jgi:hypothetical protein
VEEAKKKWAVRITLTEVVISIVLLLSGIPALVQITRIYHWIFSILFVGLLAACHTDLTGVVLSSASKDKSLDLSKWDEMAKNLRERYSKTTYWIGWSSAVALIATMIHVEFYFLAAIYFTKIVLLEAIMHRMNEYMNNEKNKTKWGAASFLYEVRKMGKETEEKDKMKGFYKDI